MYTVASQSSRRTFVEQIKEIKLLVSISISPYDTILYVFPVRINDYRKKSHACVKNSPEGKEIKLGVC